MANTILYFSKDGDERMALPAKNFIGCDMTDANTMQVSFKKHNGELDAIIVALTIATGKAKEAAEVLAAALAGRSRGLTVIADHGTSTFLHPFTAIESIS
jgi:hypothetical protein|tara:strand:- start:988 stop:1287 length:300 start_codon:yes stop_codon:yes gene_type:complete